jgi:hypothetical protein
MNVRMRKEERKTGECDGRATNFGPVALFEWRKNGKSVMSRAGKVLLLPGPTSVTRSVRSNV